jgi:hypothetical protein
MFRNKSSTRRYDIFVTTIGNAIYVQYVVMYRRYRHYEDQALQCRHVQREGLRTLSWLRGLLPNPKESYDYSPPGKKTSTSPTVVRSTSISYKFNSKIKIQVSIHHLSTQRNESKTNYKQTPDDISFTLLHCFLLLGKITG